MKLLYVGVESSFINWIQSILEDCVAEVIADSQQFQNILDDETKTFDLILASHHTQAMKSMPSNELAQGLRMRFQKTPIVFVTQSKENYNRAEYVKHGFSDAYLLPFEKSEFLEYLNDSVLPPEKVYKSVVLTDFSETEPLPCDVHLMLPLNRKYVKIGVKGGEFGNVATDKLLRSGTSRLFIRKSELQEFNAAKARKIAQLASGELNSTERQAQLQSMVRGIFTNLFSTADETQHFADGKSLVKEAATIVDNYIAGSKDGDTFKKVCLQIGADTSNYSHASNVAIFVSLFAPALEIKSVADLATAALLHDLGEESVPSEILEKAKSELTFEENTLYEGHVERSLQIIKEKRIVVSEQIHTWIAQHHERFNGTGFPKNLPGSRIAIEAQLIAIADEFDYLTRAIRGQQKLNPQQAFKKMFNSGYYDPEVIKKITFYLGLPSES
ncbi:MAG: HD domain-containing protein [Bdellovibrionales bacterium]|nr:HD domain-containing protein [Bdellovibrionales bacterium]